MGGTTVPACACVCCFVFGVACVNNSRSQRHYLCSPTTLWISYSLEASHHAGDDLTQQVCTKHCGCKDEWPHHWLRSWAVSSVRWALLYGCYSTTGEVVLPDLLLRKRLSGAEEPSKEACVQVLAADNPRHLNSLLDLMSCHHIWHPMRNAKPQVGE